MRKMLQHLGVGITIGTFIGLLVSFFISLSVGEGKFYPSTPAFMNQFSTELAALGWSIVLWSVIGIMFSFASRIIEKIIGRLLNKQLFILVVLIWDYYY